MSPEAQIEIHTEPNGRGLGTPVLLIDNQCFMNWDVFEYDQDLYLLGIKRDKETLTLTKGSSLSSIENTSPDKEFSIQEFVSLYSSGTLRPKLNENPAGENPAYRKMMKNYQ